MKQHIQLYSDFYDIKNNTSRVFKRLLSQGKSEFDKAMSLSVVCMAPFVPYQPS